MAADTENQYAQYALGKVYLIGKDVQQDKELAYDYFLKSAEQGNIYAAYFLDIAGMAAGSIAGVRRDHFFTQSHAQQEPEAG